MCVCVCVCTFVYLFLSCKITSITKIIVVTEAWVRCHSVLTNICDVFSLIGVRFGVRVRSRFGVRLG